jgi:hypothetical protein
MPASFATKNCSHSAERDRAIRERKRQIEVVIDDQDRDLASKLVERLEQLLDHGRSKAKGP